MEKIYKESLREYTLEREKSGLHHWFGVSIFSRRGVNKMAEKVAKLGVKRESGYLYFIDKDGDVSRAVMARGANKSKGSEKVASANVKKEKGYLYFLDKDGDVSRAVMARGRK